MKTTMRSMFATGLLAIGLAATGRAQISYPDFSSITGLTLNNHAAQAGSVLRVAPAAGNTAGSVWYNQRQRVLNGFDTTFDFQLHGGVNHGDGFAFVIQNSPAELAALGGFGGFLGYSFIPNSIAVEFDTFQNLSDPNDHHIGVHTRGIFNNLSNEFASIGRVDNTAFGDGSVHTARVFYDSTFLNIYLDDLLNPILSVKTKLSDIGLFAKHSAFVGFTAGTGAATQNHDILNWQFTSNPVPEPSSLALLMGAAGAAGLLLLRRRRG